MRFMAIQSVEGKRFGHLVVLKFLSVNHYGSSMWLCRCDCGIERPVNRMDLMRGSNPYCGRGNLCPVMRKENFLEKVTERDGCWIWTACIRDFGYGLFSMGYGRTINAHIASYRIFVGEIPKKKFVLHKCDNPPCVNPDHLFLGTQADNMADKTTKNRQAKGERHGMSKLTSEAVSDIRKRYAEGTIKARLAEEYGISRTHVARVINGSIWSHVSISQSSS
jgi:hypothetical protein